MWDLKEIIKNVIENEYQDEYLEEYQKEKLDNLKFGDINKIFTKIVNDEDIINTIKSNIIYYIYH